PRHRGDGLVAHPGYSLITCQNIRFDRVPRPSITIIASHLTAFGNRYMTATSMSLIIVAAIGAEPDPALIAQARADLKSPSVEVRRKVIKELIHSDLSAHLLPNMEELLKDPDGEVRSTAATAIGNLGAKSETALPALIAQLEKDTFKEARETAARALGRIGKAVPANHAAVKPLTKAAAEDADPVTRTVALGALAMMGEDVPSQVLALRKFLKHDEALVRMKA